MNYELEDQKRELLQLGFFESGHFEQVFQQADLQRFICMNRNGKPDDASRFAVNVVASVNAEGVSSRVARGCGRGPCRKPISYHDFQHLVAIGLPGLLNLDRQAPYDGFVDILHQFIHGLALGSAPRDRRDFSPEAAFVRIVNHHFNFQAHPPLDLF
jgi:hypothetical protein